MSFQTRSDWGDNRCDECLGLRFSPTSMIRHFPDCSQHPAKLAITRLRAVRGTKGVVLTICECGDPATYNGLCALCAAEFVDPEHIEGSVFDR